MFQCNLLQQATACWRHVDTFLHWQLPFGVRTAVMHRVKTALLAWAPQMPCCHLVKELQRALFILFPVRFDTKFAQILWLGWHLAAYQLDWPAGKHEWVRKGLQEGKENLMLFISFQKVKRLTLFSIDVSTGQGWLNAEGNLVDRPDDACMNDGPCQSRFNQEGRHMPQIFNMHIIYDFMWLHNIIYIYVLHSYGYHGLLWEIQHAKSFNEKVRIQSAPVAI